jgi:hypothetical protein
MLKLLTSLFCNISLSPRLLGVYSTTEKARSGHWTITSYVCSEHVWLLGRFLQAFYVDEYTLSKYSDLFVVAFLVGRLITTIRATIKSVHRGFWLAQVIVG